MDNLLPHREPMRACDECSENLIRATLLSMTEAASQSDKRARSYVEQTEIPRLSLEQAARIPQAIADNYGKHPTKPLDVAAALQLSPQSSAFRELCGASLGYGLTDGGPNAVQISLTELGRRIVAPLAEGDDRLAQREAVLKPNIIRQFLEKYDGSPLPSEQIAFNVLETMGVPSDATQRVFSIILENAEAVGYLKRIKEKSYVDITAANPATDHDERSALPEPDHTAGSTAPAGQPSAHAQAEPQGLQSSPARLANRRVFVSHGKNKRIVDQLRELLSFGDFEPIISAERETVSKPVPQKVMDDMRSCRAGIIHVSPEEKLLDKQGEERLVLNSNVLIEIGAAMALYGERFILLVEEGTTLPSNLQGLYEVRYSGPELGYEATVKVLKGLTAFKASPAS